MVFWRISEEVLAAERIEGCRPLRFCRRQLRPRGRRHGQRGYVLDWSIELEVEVGSEKFGDTN